MPLLSLLSLLLLTAVHRFVGGLRLSRIPRIRWLSLAGGISVTYIFLYVLPEFAITRSSLPRLMGFHFLQYLELHV